MWRGGVCCRRRLRWVRWCWRCQVSVGLGVSPQRGAGPSRCASSHRGTGVSTLTGCRPSRNTVRPAVPAETRGGPFPCPGSRASSSVMLRRTDARLAIGPRSQVASLGARASRTPPRAPAKPGAGPLNTGCREVPAAAAPLQFSVQRLDRRASRCAWWHVGRRVAAARDRPDGCAATAAPGKLAHRPRRCAALGEGQPVRQSSHRAPPSCAPVKSEGDSTAVTRARREAVPDTALPQQSVWVAVVEAHRPQNWHQTGTSPAQKAKKSAGANLLTLAFLGSPTWARTRDLRINSRGGLV
jgi:hypothetical protein